MTQKIKLATLALMLLCAASLQSFTVPAPAQPNTVNNVTIWLGTSAGYTVNWAPVAGTTPYMVTVLNLTTNTVHAQTFTMSTSYQLTGLQNGNSYRVSVTRGAQTGYVVIDIIDIA